MRLRTTTIIREQAEQITFFHLRFDVACFNISFTSTFFNTVMTVLRDNL